VGDKAAKLARWLLAANGALKNISQLLTESFGPSATAAATVDPTTITAYPVDPNAVPIGDYWSRADNGWAHPLHSTLLPRSSTASYHVLAGVTSRDELLVLNLAAAGYLGIEGADPIPLMRSWLMQILASTPEAQIAVDDPDLAISGAPRLRLISGPAAAPAETTALFAAGHTSGPAAPITVSGQAAGATNVVLCSGPAAGIYIANRYWPMWRRMELAETQWKPLAATLAAAAKPPVTSVDDTSLGLSTVDHRLRQPSPATSPTPGKAALSSVDDTSPVAGPPAGAAAPPPDTQTRAASAVAGDPPAANLQPPAGSLSDTTAPPAEDRAQPSTSASPSADDTALSSADDTSPVSGVRGIGAAAPAPGTPAADFQRPATPPVVPMPGIAPPEPGPASPGPPAEQEHRPDAEQPAALAQLPGPPRSDQAPQRGLFALGETYALGVDPNTGAAAKHPATTRQGVRKPIKALMMLATSSGLTTAEWDKELQFNPPNRRQARTTIRKLMGGEDPILEDSRGLLVTDLYCDWKDFQSLIGPVPTQASTEDLTAAVALIRGAPFADIPPGDYGWRSVELLRDELLDRCSDAALELARRQQAAGAATLAYQTARLGILVYPQREDLWEVALATAVDSERPGLLYDLKQAIPAPRTPELRQLLAEARSR